MNKYKSLIPKKIILILTVLSFYKSSQGQVHMEWIARYNDSNTVNYRESAMVTDADGNVYVTGEFGTTNGTENYVTLKYNSYGLLLWRSIYNGPANDFDYPLSITTDNKKNVYVTGYSFSIGFDYATVKYNSNGTEQWAARYKGPVFQDYATVVKTDNFNNVYVTGYSQGVNSDYDYLTIKYNESGIEQWVRRYNGTGNGYDKATAMVIDDSGNVIVTGYSSGIGISNYYDFATIKYSPNGDIRWVERYNSSSNFLARAYAIVVDRNGNVYVTGESDSIYQDYTTVKYNNNGTLQWVARYDGPDSVIEIDSDIAYAIALDSAGNILVTGSCSYDFVTVKYDSNGIQHWVGRYKGLDSTYDEAFALAADKFNNVYVTGYTSGGPGAFADYTTIKYDMNGIMKWVQVYNSGGGDDIARSIGLDTSGNVYISGSVNNGDVHKIATIKYSQVSNIQNTSSEVSNEYRLLQNYPNPFNPHTNINFSIPKPSMIRLTVFDVSGRKVSVLFNGSLNPGSYTIAWYAANFPSGIYLYKLISMNYLYSEIFSETKKMLLIK